MFESDRSTLMRIETHSFKLKKLWGKVQLTLFIIGMLNPYVATKEVFQNFNKNFLSFNKNIFFLYDWPD